MGKLIINNCVGLSHLSGAEFYTKKNCFNETIEAIQVYTYFLSTDHRTQKLAGCLYLNQFNHYQQQYTLPFGTYQITYKNLPIQLIIDQLKCEVDLYGNFHEAIEITLIDQSIDDCQNLNQFVSDALSYYRSIWHKETDSMIEIYTYVVKCGDGEWRKFGSKMKRSIDTLYLDQAMKTQLLETINHFIQGKETYLQYGIPYKLNLLLTGTPGMGKTTIAHILASMLNRKVYILPISDNMTNLLLIKAIAEISDDAILLCEDIDCVFVNREHGDAEKKQMTLGGFLNILDGMITKIGLITILTTNYTKQIDQALKRPGRIDLTLNFQWASIDQITQIWTKYYPQRDPVDCQTFIQLIKDKKITIADLQQYFFYVVGLTGDPLKQMDQLEGILQSNPIK